MAALLLVLGLGAVASLLAQTFPERPGPRDFLLDEASLISAQDRQRIRDICERRAADAFCQAVARCGELLGKHFPYTAGDINELGNELRVVESSSQS